MFKQFLDRVSGADVFLVISLIIFLGFFVAVAVWLVRVNKKWLEESENLPLEDDDAIDHLKKDKKNE